MEFVDGVSLGQRIEQRRRRTPRRRRSGSSPRCATGSSGAHKQGLIHRDVKPDNILVTRDGVAKLTDLGLVKEVEGDLNLTRTGRGLGTPHFMAPEQFRNAKTADVRCDIYSLGRDPLHDGHRRDAVRQRQPARLLDEEDPQRVPAAEGAEPGAVATASTGRSAGR